MAYDEELAERVRGLVAGERGVSEKRMFGGLAMLIDGNMAVAVRGQGGLLVRLLPDDPAYEKILAEKGADEAVMRDRPMRGWIAVEESACTKAADLKKWVGRGVASARALPKK
ncbi:TfoX/Sxy family protein [Hamadaea tsunoensis]|uniref:TfoX/Sxy family protein n=1 Tax=Hamadaea tsunoensis TaxID=53368 RepID=UPI000419E3C0|nr:TfoX/Sxy family protein [Hamadaea tsunoensis]